MKATLYLVFAVLVVGATSASAQAPVAGGTGTLPAGARIAFVDFDRVATASTIGKAATTQLDALRGKKAAEVADRRKQLQALQTKLADGASLMNSEALAKLQRDVERTGRDLERFTQDAQDEVQQLQIQLQRSFGEKLFPVIGEVAQAKNVWAVFRLEPANVLWYDKALDISDEVVAKLDGKAVTAPTAPPAPQR
jgi:outer membrane protein